MHFLCRHIRHVIYIVKENRTFDQILGDLGNGSNGDRSLTQFPESITPNFHRLSRQFVTLDNFMDPGDGSMDGWSWSLQGRVTNTETITQQINYAFVNRGLSYESEGTNRNVPVNFATVAERDAAAGTAGTANYSAATASLPGGTANVLTGIGNHASSDAPFGIQDGYIFSAVLQAGGTVPNYGFLVNNIGSIGSPAAPVSDPFAAAIVQVAPLDRALAPMTDVYFRGYDQNYPDLWRFNEWKREFDQFVAQGNLPRSLREAGRGGQRALQPGKRAAHHRGRPRHAAPEPEHGVPAPDERSLRHRVVGQVELPGGGFHRPEDHHARAGAGGPGRALREGAGRQAEARRQVLGEGHGRVRLLRCRPPTARQVQQGSVGWADERQSIPSRARSPGRD